MTDSPSRATPWGGMRKERPCARNTSMTAMTSSGSAFAIAAMRESGVGRRISRLSGPRSVRHLSSRSAILPSRSVVSAPNASSACRDLLHERPKARERVDAGASVHNYVPANWATKGRNTPGSNAPSARMMETSRVRKLSFVDVREFREVE